MIFVIAIAWVTKRAIGKIRQEHLYWQGLRCTVLFSSPILAIKVVLQSIPRQLFCVISSVCVCNSEVKSCDWSRHIQESPHPRAPESPKKSQKGLPGPPGPECQKSVEKVPNDPKKSRKDYKISVRGLFRHFFDTPGREAREVLFETFWGVSGLGGVGVTVNGEIVL